MDTQKTIDGLRAARALIEKGWTQGEMARDKDGHCVSFSSHFARSWCVLGACRAVDPRGLFWQPLALALEFETQQPLDFGLAGYNDHPDRTKADVLALFDRAIARLEADAAVSS